MWIFEVFQTLMGVWYPMTVGSENECREQYDWYMENRPDLAPQLNLRDTEKDPDPPEPPDLGS